LGNRKYKGIIHFHSRFSYDSCTPSDYIIRKAKEMNLDFLLLTDHNTTKGSEYLRDLAKRLGVNIIIPVSAEYSTEMGDIIAAFIKNEITYHNYENLISKIKEQEGVVILPHPYYKHNNIERLVDDADMIEIYNPYIDQDLNRKAEHTAHTKKKQGFYGSDSHLRRSFGNIVVYVENKGNLRTSLLAGNIQYKKITDPGPYEKTLTQMIKAVKKTDLKLFIMITLKLVRLFIKRLINAY